LGQLFYFVASVEDSYFYSTNKYESYNNKICFVLVSCFPYQDQLLYIAAIDPALLQKARAAGITQEQIDEAMKSQNSPGAAREKDNTVKVTANEAKERVIPKTIVPSDSVIKKPLGVFGREIFSTRNLTFAPDYNMPTPAGYILAAGDEVIIDVWGASEFNANLKISSEGHIILPGVGLVYLNGLSIDQAEQKIKSALKRIMAELEIRPR
jgi:protein involved in polysaccharide export with SLBB domain